MPGIGDSTDQDVHLAESEDPLQATEAGTRSRKARESAAYDNHCQCELLLSLGPCRTEHQMLYAQGLGGERAPKIGLSCSTARMQALDTKPRTCVLWMVRPTARNDY